MALRRLLRASLVAQTVKILPAMWERITDSMDMNLRKLWDIVEDREAWHPAVHGVEKSQTQPSSWTELNILYSTVTFSTDKVVQPSLLSIPKYFYHPPKNLHIESLLISTSLSAPGYCYSTFCLLTGLPISDISYEWNHIIRSLIIFDFFHLA